MCMEHINRQIYRLYKNIPEFLKFVGLIGPRGQKIMRSANNVGNAGPHVRQTFCINPAVSKANMVDTCKHFEIGSGSVRSLSHLPVFVIEHLCRAKGATNTKQIK